MERIQSLLGVTPITAYIIWASARALVYIALVSACIQAITRDRKVTAAYLGAHAAAILGGCIVDVILFFTLPKEHLSARLMEFVFVIPIFLFTAIALWICHQKKPLTMGDMLMPVLPITAWGCLVIWGWQDMDQTHVMGAWFVSAGSGAADIVSLYGPAWATKRRLLTRFAGCAIILALIYLILPLTV